MSPLVYICFLALACFEAKAQDLSEAEQIALESTSKLLPPPSLVQRIEKDLSAIRTKYSIVADVKHTPKWSPGRLVVSNPKKEAIDKINTSSYGPVETSSLFGGSIVIFTFKKPYNPIKLGNVLKNEFGIEGTEPDGIIGSSSSITLTSDPSGKNTYVFFQGSGDCPAGCINKTFLTFIVGPEQNPVQLVEQKHK